MDWRPPAGPFRAFRDRYVAPFGGLSYDLAPRAVGIHPEHLKHVPELAGREVLVSADGIRPAPLHTRPSFQVVPVHELMRDARGVAEQGVVFSVFDLDDPLAGGILQRFLPGESLFLNSAVERLRDPIRRPGDSAA